MLLHQEVCDTLGISRGELAEKLGVSKATLDSWSDESRMSKTARVALELMLENDYKTRLIGSFNEALSGFKTLDNSFRGEVGEKQDLIKRMRYILDEYGLNVIEASKKLNEPTFDYLDKVLKFKIVPSFDFLNKFSSIFQISNEWLLNGKEHPFDFSFIRSISLRGLSEEIVGFEKVYILCCDDNKSHTRIAVKDKLGRYDFYHNMFCIGHNFIMSGIECSDLYDLYVFYKKHKYSIHLVSLSVDEYRRLLSKEHYAKNILDGAKHSYMLDDLFDLDYFNKEKYDKFFIECTDIIKAEKAYLEKKEREKEIERGNV